jgi:predicted amidohydrolase
MTEDSLRILIIQPDIVWNNPSENIRRLSAMLHLDNRSIDLLLLPEMFTTGFISTPQLISVDSQLETLDWMKKTAAERNCSVAGSVVYKEKDNYFNRLLCIHHNGKTDHYDKRHLFCMDGEEDAYTCGTKRTISIIKGWRICWQVCYDLRFPVWSRNQGDYDVLVYSANWPAQRSDIWNALLRARAIENQAYVIGVNRVGRDANNIEYLGESMVVNFKGITINEAAVKKELAIFCELTYSSLLDFRSRFPVWKDTDKFKLI